MPSDFVRYSPEVETYASFSDPDGNGWLVQEITTRLPGREWADTTPGVAARAGLLHETARHHDHYEKTHAPHNWWDWYGAYFDAREHGQTPDEAVAARGPSRPACQARGARPAGPSAPAITLVPR